MKQFCTIFPLVLLFLATSARSAERVAESYVVTVWASVLFDREGKAGTISIVDKTDLSPKFIQGVEARLVQARIPPRLDQGQPATFRTGVRLLYRVTPTKEGGTVTLAGLDMAPLPRKQFVASFPKDVPRSEDWEGSVSATCVVGVDGRCKSIDVKTLPGMPESVRRFATASFTKWEFEPQALNGKPIEGAFTQKFSLLTRERGPEDFRESKFDRIDRTR